MAFSTGVFQVFFDLIRTKLIRAGRPGKCDGKREMKETFERERNIWKKLVESGDSGKFLWHSVHPRHKGNRYIGKQVHTRNALNCFTVWHRFQLQFHMLYLYWLSIPPE